MCTSISSLSARVRHGVATVASRALPSVVAIAWALGGALPLPASAAPVPPTTASSWAGSPLYATPAATGLVEEDLDVQPRLQDLRVGYRLLSDAWRKVDMVRLEIAGVRVRHRADPLSCLPEEYAEAAAAGKLEPMLDEDRIDDVIYASTVPTTWRVTGALHDKVLPLPALNQLPDGLIIEIRLLLSGAWVTVDGKEVPVALQDWQRSDGIKLGAATPVPVCVDYLTSVELALALDQLLPGDFVATTLLKDADPDPGTKPHLEAALTAPLVLFGDQPATLVVAGAARLEVPAEALKGPLMLRVKSVSVRSSEQFSAPSVDPLFNRLMQPVGEAFDFMPDALRFHRPITIALDTPIKRTLTPKSLARLAKEGVEASILKQLNSIVAVEWDDELALLARIDRLAEGRHVVRIIDSTETVPTYDPEALALYTFSPKLGIWTPDMPVMHAEHLEAMSRELERVIAAKDASSDLTTHFPPDLSAIAWEEYGSLRLNDVNNSIVQGYVVTATNHFCKKSLFADLNVATNNTRTYLPLLDGAFDDMCQGDGFGWVHDSNDDVHCGGSLPSAADLRADALKARRLIDRNGVAVRFRLNTRHYFESLAPCPASGSAGYCYDLYDLEEDVRWAVATWREVINRNPDGSSTDRFHINCWQIDDDDSNCAGDEIDIGVDDLGPNAAAQTSGVDITIDRQTMNDARNDVDGRTELRSIVAHELGHALGLSHWAGPGTLMSYQGRNRSNLNRINLCGAYTQAQLDGVGGVVMPLVSDCVTPDRTQPGTTVVLDARINRVTCTDIERLRNNINDGPDWSDTLPLQCELLAAQTEYTVLEVPQFDPVTNELYHTLDFDLRFAHCGYSPQFDRLELELLGVDPENVAEVINLYDSIIGVDPLVRDADDMYTVHVSLDSRHLVGTLPTVDAATGVSTYESFAEYRDARGYRSLALSLRAFTDADDGVRGEFVSASTGLLRAPFLAPISVPLAFGVSDILEGGVSIADSPLVTVFSDAVTSPDLFPYITEPMLKPSVPGALYIALPPTAAGAGAYSVSFAWSMLEAQLDAGPYGPTRLWVDSVEIYREQVPTIEDWQRAGAAVVSSDHVATYNYTGEPTIVQDPCEHTASSFELPPLSDDPLVAVTAPNGQVVNAWDLYRVRINYDFVHYQNAGCTAGLDVCAPGTPCMAGPLSGTRSQDYYVSIAGPSAGFLTPRGLESLCLYDASIYGEYYTVAGDFSGVQVIAAAFPEWQFQARISGESGRVHMLGGGICGAHTVASAWTDAAALAADGVLTFRPKWQNNCDDAAYSVRLEYRYRAPGAAAWTVVRLDALRLRIDSDNNDCNSDSYDYERACSPWDEDYMCKGDGIMDGA